MNELFENITEEVTTENNIIADTENGIENNNIMLYDELSSEYADLSTIESLLVETNTNIVEINNNIATLNGLVLIIVLAVIFTMIKDLFKIKKQGETPY